MRMMRLRNKKGFTLIEMVVILAVIGILAAVLTPMLISYIDDARQRRAESDVRTIGAAILAFNKDLRKWPIWKSTTASDPVDVLYSDAADAAEAEGAAAKGFDTSSNADTLENQLITNAPDYSTSGKRKWRGPYLESIDADPWGHRYYVNAKYLHQSGYAAFVLSAGPNGKIETDGDPANLPTTFNGAGGDDIIYRIK